MLSEREAFIGFIARIGREGGLILILGVCVFIMLALLSFDAQDPGWSHLGQQPHLENLAGPAGAWLADFCYATLGYLALFPPVAIALSALSCFRKDINELTQTIPFWALKTAGILLFLLTSCALASLHFTAGLMNLPFGAGGMLGLSLSDFAVRWLGLIGATIVLFTGWLLGITLFTHLSWFRLAETLGAYLAAATLAIRDRTQQLFNGDRSEAEPSETRYQQPSAPQNKTENKPAVETESEFDIDNDDSNQSPTLMQRLRGIFSRSADADISMEKSASEYSLPHSPDSKPSGSDNGRNNGPDLGDLQLGSAVDAQEKLREDRTPPWGTETPLTAAKDGAEKTSAGTHTNTMPDSAAEADKHLKIVPLSETVKPLDTDKDDDVRTPQSSNRTVPSSSQAGRKQVPSLALLDPPETKHEQGYSPEQLEDMSRLLEAKLKDFGVVAEVVEVNPGPVITRFEIQPAPGTKVSKISNLAKDLARSMAVLSVRVVEVIAGKSVVGIEIPNEDREIVRLSEVLGAPAYTKAESKLSLGLGNDIAGNPVVVNLSKMPHLLVAGTTGSGKSVGVNAMLLSLLFKATPDQVRLMMVDPKMLELSIYDGIPHLLTPVITDMKEAASGLRWCVAEMERRYRLMAKMGVRNLAGFNNKIRAANDKGEPIADPLWNPLEEGFDENAPAPALEPLPYIVVVIDEFADMMMIVGKKVEELIARIAQKARAAGIHLILATQRPSVDVITGLIKANVPTRIAFQVSSKIDSRTILDQSGAENLLGHGDMLYLPAGTSMPSRVHGAFVADDEVHRVVEAWKAWGPAEFVEEILQANVDMDTTASIMTGNFDEESDSLYDEAVNFVIQSRRASISAVQRKLKIGYNRAARMVEQMEAAGVVSEAGSNGSREVLAPPPAEG